MSDYTYWRNALAGKFGPVHDGEPQAGFWRKRAHKDGPWQAIAIWQDELGLWHALCDNNVISAQDIWTWACRNPITEELYRQIEAGGRWPDDIRGNNPPADETIADEIDSAIAAALDAVKAPPKTQLDADILGNHRDRLAKLYSAQEKEREAEKRPHLEAGRAVDAKFKPVLGKIEAAGKAVKAALTVWLNAEAERIRRETMKKMYREEEARRAAIAANVPPPPVAMPEIERPKAGTTGRATALRTIKTGVVVDYKAALTHFREDPAIVDTVKKLANAAAREGRAVPGVEIKEEMVAI